MSTGTTVIAIEPGADISFQGTVSASKAASATREARTISDANAAWSSGRPFDHAWATASEHSCL